MNVLEDRSPVLPTMDFVPFVRLTSSSHAVAACRNVSGVRIERFQWPGMPGAPQNSVHLSDTSCLEMFVALLPLNLSGLDLMSVFGGFRRSRRDP